MKTKTTIFLFILIAGISILSVSKAVSLVKENGCTDLLCRTVSARLFHYDKTAYFYKWTAGESRFFLNPNNQPGRKVNGNVVTPAVLQFFYAAAQFSYPVVKAVWVILQYVFFLLAIFFLTTAKDNERKNILIPVVITLALYLCSKIWFYNIERGQIYSFYFFLLSLIYFLYQCTWRFGRFTAGFVHGLSVFFRPLFVFFAIPFLLKKDLKMLAGSFCGFTIGLFLFVLPNLRHWKDYFSAMKVYSTEIIEKKTVFAIMTNVPADLEGLASMQKAQTFLCGGLSTIQYYFASRNISLQPPALMIIYATVVLLCCFFYVKAKPAHLPFYNDNDFLFAFFLYILSELFIIGHRAGYNQIQWVFAVFLIMQQKNLPLFIWVGLIAGIILENIRIAGISYQFELAEIILFCCLFYVVAGGSHIRGMTNVFNYPSRLKKVARL